MRYELFYFGMQYVFGYSTVSGLHGKAVSLQQAVPAVM